MCVHRVLPSPQHALASRVLWRASLFRHVATVTSSQLNRHALALGSSCDASSVLRESGFCSRPLATLSRLELLLTSTWHALVLPNSARRCFYTDLSAHVALQGSSSSRSSARALNCPSLHSVTSSSPSGLTIRTGRMVVAGLAPSPPPPPRLSTGTRLRKRCHLLNSRGLRWPRDPFPSGALLPALLGPILS